VKKKFNKILGVALTVAMLASLFVFAAPVAAAEGNMQWLAQPLPTALFNVLDNGANAAVPTYFAVASDGSTIYAIDSAIAANAAGCILKSVDGGQSFLAITAPGTAGGVLRYVAISPTNPSVVAVAERIPAALDAVYVSTNGGVTWTALPAINAVASGAINTEIMGLGISPDRTDSLFNRDYVIAVADSTAGPAGLAGAAGLQIIGATPAAGWANFGTAAYDYLTVAVSPNYLGDRAVIAVSDNVAGTWAEVWNNTWPAVAPALYPTTVAFPRLLNAAAVEAAAANETADIALPSDFDPTTATGMRFWVGIASAAAGVGQGGIYRVDASQTPELLALGLTGTRVNSVAYSGTVASGTLFAGFQTPGGINALCAPVSYTTQAQTNLPVWTPSLKPPTGAGFGGVGRPIVRVSPNFTTDKKVYAMTIGNESALSISTDAGVSFNQEAIINLGAANVAAVDAIALTPDATTLFVVSRAAGRVSVWQTATAPTAISWSRIWCANAGNPCLISLNLSGWATAPEIYVVNTVAGTPNGMFASYDGGATFNVRSTPLAPVNDLAVASSKVVYVASGTNVYKSILGGSVWGSPVPANANAIITLVTAGNDVLVGGTGACSRSTDAGTSFVQLPIAGLPVSTFTVLPDEDYATNKIIYAGDTATIVANNIYRINADTGAVWENILNPTAPATVGLIGLGMSNGALYGMANNAAVAPIGILTCDRTLNPLSSVGTITWGTMNIPVGAALLATSFDVAQNKVYVAVGAGPTLWAYNDTLATAKSTITSPASGTMVAVDPVTGRAEVVAMVWNAMGSGTGLVNQYTMAIYEKAQGLSGAVFIPIQGPGAPLDLVVPTAPRCSIWPFGTAVAAPDIAYTLIAGREYGIQIRALDEVSNDTINSPFSDPVYFTIEAATGVITPPYAGPMLQAPQLGGTGVAIKPAFAWAPMSGVITWDFEISKSSALNADGTYTTPVKSLIGASALTTNSWSCDIDLEYSTPYVWHVQGTNATGGKTIWGIGSFTTKAAEVFTCPIDGLTFPTQAALEAHNAVAHAPTTPLYVWVIVIIGAVLVITVIVLIVTTRRTPSP
jgi:hypothetical protein